MVYLGKENELVTFVRTIDFAAKKHRDGRRKDEEGTPYINHPIGVCKNASEIGGITDLVTLQACALHDTVEDTETIYEELVAQFGSEVADVVMELTDDRSLSKPDRKRAQIEHVKTMSVKAKIVKLCDKLYNLLDFINNPPKSYSLERIQGYCVWSRMVLEGARGVNAALENAVDSQVFNAQFVFKGASYPCCPEGLDECHIFPST